MGNRLVGDPRPYEARPGVIVVPISSRWAVEVGGRRVGEVRGGDDGWSAFDSDGVCLGFGLASRDAAACQVATIAARPRRRRWRR